MRILVCKDYNEVSQKAAQMILSQITLKPNCVLGLATGSTPIGMYENLVTMYQQGLVDFSEVQTFNLDEYLSISPTNEQSYHYFMNEYLFNHVNIDKNHIHIPNGMADSMQEECIRYEQLIKDVGGIDIQVLGIGHNAHIGYNEPTINFEKGTHIVELDESTRQANARFFNHIDEVPKYAITMGTGSIFKSRKIMLLATGTSKAQAIHDMVYGKVQPEVPASILQFHHDVVLILDEEAASLLLDGDYKRV